MNSSTEREHEVEATRARLDRTLDTLQARLNLSSLAEDLVGTPTPGRTAGESARRLVQTVRENIVPAALIGAGLGYLLYDAVRLRAYPPLGAARGQANAHGPSEPRSPG